MDMDVAIFQPCIDSFRTASIDDGSEIIDLLKQSMKLNRKMQIPLNDATTTPKQASVKHCLKIFQSISDDIVCETIIETLQQFNASKFPIYKKLIPHFSPEKFKFEITQPSSDFLYVSISSLSGGSQCLKLSLPNPTSLQIDSLDKCAADKGPELLKAVHSFARTIPTITHIKLNDVSSVDVCGVSIPLAALKIVTTGQSWYNRYHYYSENFLVETQHNQDVINRLFKDIISERQDIFSPHIINEMNELLPISPDVTFKDYMLAFEQSIGRDKDCDKRKATLLRSIMLNVDDNMWKSNVSRMDTFHIPFLMYRPELQLDLSKHGGKRRRLQTMRNYKKGAKKSKRHINKSKRHINKSKRKINKCKRNITKCK
jgi:hypothetical protein